MCDRRILVALCCACIRHGRVHLGVPMCILVSKMSKTNDILLYVDAECEKMTSKNFFVVNLELFQLIIEVVSDHHCWLITNVGPIVGLLLHLNC